ncbi:uncharacterized protein B0I36DRAFT_345851 [Microdochium trichocladiopsis]|uniref:DUF5672 domain-containing protein n=1 Tax=Microdochium trichocladiopsis TaxID=1682393 RepID=A0A9P8YBQ6_9PEZI|nr:uncharacterized protein B0I36DRAFT_345851 [Microdochium trichocladiopsis]KAH7037786.1 hypothetical protein B0I36DRAFT_345851 [Microdochium trichocladiopsis]
MRKFLTKNSLFLGLSLVLVWVLAGIVREHRDEIHAELHEKVDKVRQKIPKVKVDWHKLSSTGHFVDDEDSSPSPFNRTKLAILVEPRPLPHLVPQILHMISVVPPDWKFLFVGSNQSVISVGRAWATKHQQKIGKLDLITMPEPWQINSKEGVFRLMTDIRFYDEFLPGVEWLLKYEHDSIMCANSPISLNQWLSWDWTGAPRSGDDKFSGNGGLTLRRVSAIRRVLAIQSRLNNTDPEDEWFGRRVLVLPGAKVASAAHGQFAVEDHYIPQAMGFHVREGGAILHQQVWKNHTRRKEIFDYCPELSIIMDMKLERERCPNDDREGSLTTEQAPTPTPEPPAPPPAPPAAPPAAAPAAAAAKQPAIDDQGFQVEPDASPETAQALDEVLSNNQNFDQNGAPQQGEEEEEEDEEDEDEEGDEYEVVTKIVKVDQNGNLIPDDDDDGST